MNKAELITLNFPVEVAGRLIDQVSLSRPTVKHLMSFDKAEGDMAKMVSLVADLADLMPAEINAIDASDFMRLSTVVEGFLDGGTENGGT